MTTTELTAGGRIRLWSATSTVTSGVATFYPTDDGTAGGVAMFQMIETVHPTAEKNTSTMSDVPTASLKAISGDRKTITVNCTVGTVLGILGATILAAPNG